MIWPFRINISPSAKKMREIKDDLAFSKKHFHSTKEDVGNHVAIEWAHICCSVLILVPPSLKIRKFLPRKTPEITKDFVCLPKPRNPWKTQGKCQNNRKFLAQNEARKSKKPRKARIGFM